MAINVQDPNQRRKLQNAVQYAWEQLAPSRERRNSLIRLHNDDSDLVASLWPDEKMDGRAAFVNYFQMFVRGHVLTLSYQNPKWSVMARNPAGRGFDTRIKMFLNYYFDVLNFTPLLRQLAIDTAFGDCCVKVVDGPAPKGVNSPLAPRVYRVNPNDLVYDWSAESFESASFVGDMYLLPLSEAQAHEEFDPNVRASLTPYKSQTRTYRADNTYSDAAFAEDMTQLLDVYLPTAGVVVTFPCSDGSFAALQNEPLKITPTPVNPYSVCRIVQRPDSVESLHRLWSLRESHLLANDMWQKAAKQSRQMRRNPIDSVGNADNASELFSTPDGETVLLNDPATLNLYTLPGADSSTVQMAGLAGQTFSEQAGNLNVALGINPGAKTARQTEAILGQIGSVSEYDRSLFEDFISAIGKKVATLAFHSETLQMTMQATVPGTNLSYPVQWAPAAMLPRVGTVSDYAFKIAPYSTGYETPSERVEKLQAASQQVLQWMMAAGSGAPINLSAVLKDIGEAYGIEQDLLRWWTGEKPSPAEQVGQVYRSMASPSEGSTVRYEGNQVSNTGVPFTQPDVAGLRN